METKTNYESMPTKALTALLPVVDEQDRAVINKILESRSEPETPRKPDAMIGETPRKPDAIIGETPRKPDAIIGETPRKPDAMLTDDECAELVKSLRVNVYHRCHVIPFDSTEWTGGYIASVIWDHKRNIILYAIRTDDNRKIVKVYNSKQLCILDEKVMLKKQRGRKPKMFEESLQDRAKKAMVNVGKMITFESRRVITENGERVETTTGRIIAVVPKGPQDRKLLLYRIVPEGADPKDLSKITHKVIDAKDIVLSEDFDEEGALLNAKYLKRKRSPYVDINPQGRVLRCQDEVRKAEEDLKKAAERLELKKAQLEQARKDLDTYLRVQTFKDIM